MTAPQKGVRHLAPSQDVLFSTKLASSGLDTIDAANLGIYFVEDCSTIHPSYNNVKAMVLPYPKLNGTSSTFHRVRYLEQPKGFAAKVAKPQRYAQEPGSLNEVYLPRSLPWAVIAKDPSMEIVITEGELKAACAASHGITCLALGGVDVWASSKRNVALLEPLDEINWKGRVVTIVFDSDASINPNVARASVTLAKKLLALGALPRVATLPPKVTGEKQGLDDFLVDGGDISQVLAEVRSLDLGAKFAEINNRYAYVIDQDVVVEIATGRRMKRDSFTNGVLANLSVVEYQPNNNGTLKRVEVRVASEWMKWAARLDVSHFTYEPGKPQITEENAYNAWRGWGCEAIPGDVQPWHDLMEYLFGGDAVLKWVEQWIAYPLQHPGAKLFSSVVLWGPETGTGKSLVGYTIGRFYGDNFGEIGNQELHNSFNEWAVNKQFILGDEISGSDKRQEADKLKALITQQQLRINMKNLPTYTVPDCINYYFTSNHPDAFFLDDMDRRFAIHRTVGKIRREPEFYTKYIDWLNNGGQEALFNYFLNVDISTFNPAAPAPMTKSKMELIDHGRSDLSCWVAHFLSNTEMELMRLAEYLGIKSDHLDLVMNSHLKWLYDPSGTSRVTANGLGRELSRFGFKTVGPIYTKTFGKQRFYIIRNTAMWMETPPTMCAAHIDATFPSTSVVPKF